MKIFEIKNLGLLEENEYINNCLKPTKNNGFVVGYVKWCKLENPEQVHTSNLYSGPDNNKKGNYFLVARRKIYIKFFEEA